MKKTIAEEWSPNYFKGQLLQAEDFLAEQDFHVGARLRHNRRLHHWGIVDGLALTHKGDNVVIVHPGIAVDRAGQELELEEGAQIDITHPVPNAMLRIGLSREEIAGGGYEPGEALSRRRFQVAITVSEDIEESEGVTLGIVRLDEKGRIGKDGLDFSRTRHAGMVAPGTITHHELNESLRKGWMRLPFRPDPLVDPPDGEEEIPPSFRLGATEARSPHVDQGETDRGAGGTMAFPLPPNIRHVRKFRIAGSLNKGGITLRLHAGGWDPAKKEHIHKEILIKKITASPFDEIFAIEGAMSALDPECQTLSIWLRGAQKTSVSLVAVELEY